MADADARAAARGHTTQLLKMLRGYGPKSEAELAAESPVAPPKPAAVAEATPAYLRLLDAVPTSPPAPPVQVAPSPLPLGPDEPSNSSIASMRTVGEVLRHPSGVLGKLMARASRLVRLSGIFRAYLPPLLRDHAVLLELNAERWEVQTDSAAWATRLRYALPTIRQALGQQLNITLPKPRIRVMPAAVPSPAPHRRLTLTRRNAEVLEAAARAQPDPRLSAALRRLAAHGRSGPRT
jgi:hypothetical protein